MKRLWSCVWVLLFASAMLIAFERRALAYVDPGSGLMIVQTVGALATGAMIWFRRHIKALFLRGRTPKPDQPA